MDNRSLFKIAKRNRELRSISQINKCMQEELNWILVGFGVSVSPPFVVIIVYDDGVAS